MLKNKSYIFIKRKFEVREKSEFFSLIPSRCPSIERSISVFFLLSLAFSCFLAFLVSSFPFCFSFPYSFLFLFFFLPSSLSLFFLSPFLSPSLSSSFLLPSLPLPTLLPSFLPLPSHNSKKRSKGQQGKREEEAEVSSMRDFTW